MWNSIVREILLHFALVKLKVTSTLLLLYRNFNPLFLLVSFYILCFEWFVRFRISFCAFTLYSCGNGWLGWLIDRTMTRFCGFLPYNTQWFGNIFQGQGGGHWLILIIFLTLIGLYYFRGLCGFVFEEVSWYLLDSHFVWY